jgi:hypothetical protein
MTHEGLCDRAILWLRNTRNCGVTLSNLSVGLGEIPDAIGWKYGTQSTLVECKVSRSDFIADAKKAFRRFPETGMGAFRYFMVPDGLVKPTEIPAGWGLLYVRNRSVREVKRGEVFLKFDSKREMTMLTSALRRVQLRIDKPLHKWLRWENRMEMQNVDV